MAASPIGAPGGGAGIIVMRVAGSFGFSMKR